MVSAKILSSTVLNTDNIRNLTLAPNQYNRIKEHVTLSNGCQKFSFLNNLYILILYIKIKKVIFKLQ